MILSDCHFSLSRENVYRNGQRFSLGFVLHHRLPGSLLGVYTATEKHELHPEVSQKKM